MPCSDKPQLTLCCRAEDMLSVSQAILHTDDLASGEQVLTCPPPCKRHSNTNMLLHSSSEEWLTEPPIVMSVLGNRSSRLSFPQGTDQAVLAHTLIAWCAAHRSSLLLLVCLMEICCVACDSSRAVPPPTALSCATKVAQVFCPHGLWF